MFGGRAILPKILGGYVGDEANLAEFLGLWPLELFESGTLEDAVDRNLIFEIFQSRWEGLLRTMDQSLERNEGRHRAYSAATCANCAKFVGGGIFEGIHVDGIVAIIDSFVLPKLGRNKHDKFVDLSAARWREENIANCC